ncbi:MAG TPA: sulfotransferase family 2 domain-containing protein [Methylomirabilota bacterium]
MTIQAPASLTNPAPPVLIFLHIPKTAGSTLTDILRRQYSPEATFLTGGPRRPGLEQFEALPLHQRERFACLAGHMMFGVHRLLPRPARYLTILRDPVDRVMSLYYYIRGLPEHPMHERVLRDRITLEDFVRLIPSDEQVRFLSGPWDGGAAPTPREMLERAERNITEHFATFGLAERFDESLVLFKRMFGWRHLHYYRRNVTKVRPPLSALAPSTVAAVERHNVLDLELYKFATTAFDRMLQAHGIRPVDVMRFRMLNRLHGVVTAASTKLRLAGLRWSTSAIAGGRRR